MEQKLCDAAKKGRDEEVRKILEEKQEDRRELERCRRMDSPSPGL